MPIGFVKGDNSFYTVTYYGEKDEVGKIKQIPILPNVVLNDVADVKWSYKKRMSGYEGNGKPAIALSIQRAPQGSVLDVSTAARAEMKKLEAQYPNIQFEISDTQRDLIQLANTNMLSALRDANNLYSDCSTLLFREFQGNYRGRAIHSNGVFFYHCSHLAFRR